MPIPPSATKSKPGTNSGSPPVLAISAGVVVVVADPPPGVVPGVVAPGLTVVDGLVAAGADVVEVTAAEVGTGDEVVTVVAGAVLAGGTVEAGAEVTVEVVDAEGGDEDVELDEVDVAGWPDSVVSSSLWRMTAAVTPAASRSRITVDNPKRTMRDIGRSDQSEG